MGDALRDIKGMAGEDAMLRWAGKSAEAFTSEFEDVPKNLKKLKKSYDLAGDALAKYWPELEKAQADSLRALEKGRQARKDLSSANGRLESANDWVKRAEKKAKEYEDEGKKKDVPPPDEKDVRAATRNATNAGEAKESAQSAVDSANSALAAAKRMAEDARKLREDAASACKKKLEEASDAGIQNRSWWEEGVDWVSDNWDTIVTVCKVVVAVVGIIAMIIGGPILGAIVLVAALVVLADTLHKYANGEASLWDVAFAALDCIPGMKGLTSLGGLAKGLKGLAAGGLKGMANGIKGLAKSGRDMIAKGAKGAHDRLKNLVRSRGSDPVDMATGKMYLPQTDVTLPGTLPLTFSRRVESGYGAGGWFGPSWSSTIDQHLEIDEQGVVFVTEDGLLLAYPHPTGPEAPVLPLTGPRWPLARLEDGGYTVTDPLAGHTRRFTTPGEDRTALLARISDRNGNTITVDYTPERTPTGLRHSGGYHLKLTTEAGRITALALANAAEDGTDVRIKRYGYTDGNLTEVYNSSNQPLRFTYDDRLRVTSWTDTNNHSYAYTYDARDRCIAEGGEAGHITITLDYDGTDPAFPGARVTTLTTAEGATTRFVINDAGEVIAEIDALGHTTRTEYGENHHVTAVTDALGHTTTFANNPTGQPLTITRPDGSTLHYAYNQHGQPLTLNLPDDTTWLRDYDDRGNCTAVTDPTGATTRYTYDARGSLTSVTDALDATTRIRCNTAGLPCEIADPVGSRLTREHDAFGRVTTVTDPLGAETRLWWTVEGHITRARQPDGAEQTWTYDGEGNCTAHTDPVGGTTQYEYTHFDLLTARTTPDGARYEFAHDASLRLTQVTNPQGLTWIYGYDPAGRLAFETDFDGRNLTYTHDPAGRLTSRANTLGETIHFTHDVFGRTTTKDAAGKATHYTYDPLGRLTQAANPEASLALERDPLGRVLAETVNGRTISYRYDPLGRRTTRTTPTGATSIWTYDAAGRRTSLNTAGHALAFTHDAAGREQTRHIGDTLTLAHTFDPSGRLTSQSLVTRASVTDSETLRRRAYSYRPDGYLATVTDEHSGTRTFNLDAMGRVTAVHATGWTERYAYDEAGNQTEADWPANHAAAESTGTRSYTGTRITRAGTTRYEHDTQGRVVLRQKTRLSRKPDTWRYHWDAEDRLTEVVTPDGTHWHYLYDPLGRRIAKQRLTGTGEVAEQVHFTWDGTTLAEQTTTTPGDRNQITLTWDHNGLQPLTQTERLTNATSQHEIDRRFFAIVTDLVGTPTELVDETGSIAWHTRTTLWGTTTWATNSTAHTPLRFPGQYWDAETGLHYNFHRYYEPLSGRYISSDPLGLAPSPNPVAYVHNPQTWYDPFGLSPYDRYRRDSRSPEDIFGGDGFAPRGDNMSLEEHVYGVAGDYTPPSGYVSTTQSLDHALSRQRRSGGYVYHIQARDGGIDANAALPGNPHADELEFSYPRTIDPSEILGAWDSGGNWTANPRFGG
nr:DUF6531 domain-containing protein [Streptomyces sp. Ru87]